MLVKVLRNDSDRIGCPVFRVVLKLYPKEYKLLSFTHLCEHFCDYPKDTVIRSSLFHDSLRSQVEEFIELVQLADHRRKFEEYRISNKLKVQSALTFESRLLPSWNYVWIINNAIPNRSSQNWGVRKSPEFDFARETDPLWAVSYRGKGKSCSWYLESIWHN
jgi:hypothetical protein